jgi:hypothetical protein
MQMLKIRILDEGTISKIAAGEFLALVNHGLLITPSICLIISVQQRIIKK